MNGFFMSDSINDDLTTPPIKRVDQGSAFADALQMR
jgi:hypothetical protein